MNRRSFLYAAAIAGTQNLVSRSSSAELTQNTPSRKTSESAERIERATSAALAMQRRDWEQGIFAQALLQSGQRERLIQLTKAAMMQQVPDGRMAVVVNGGPTDPAMGGAAYAQAVAWTGDAAVHEAVERMLDWILNKAPRNAEGILYHTFEAPQMWSDGINGAPPFLAAMGHYDEALRQIEGYRKLLFNPEKKLMAHIWDDGKHQFSDPAFWGGGNGWTAAGLARVIRSLPAERKSDRNHLVAFARGVIDGCLLYQRSDGLFHNVIDQPDTFVETNLAQMLAFTIYQGMSDGWIPITYRAFADKMRTAARSKMDAYGFVQGACSAPDFDRPGISTEAQAFCILMEAAGQAFE
ncbi:glycoside hydrolase family 88 protein [Telmatobacter sp. DSM 110680]|uniref:Glycoside hydrolase family 88 protein n=1 Tax=Telmatobacter sp. DSM 110680 TaxID=3036704 RepID=A0AAU7DKI7_9BACT